MKSKIGMELIGDTALVSALAELGRSQGGAALDSSLRRGANVLKGEVQRRWDAAKHVNETAASSRGQAVAVVKKTGRPRHSPEMTVGMTGGAMNTAHWVEFGTQKHSVKKGASIRRGVFVGHQPMHPGNRPNPFFAPAFEAKGEEAK
ncbi:MAG: hypothetical protein JJ979_25380, partial [Roseibium sp.]|nr:hypothetical protein [Roseibium sp.]